MEKLSRDKNQPSQALILQVFQKISQPEILKHYQEVKFRTFINHHQEMRFINQYYRYKQGIYVPLKRTRYVHNKDVADI